VENVYTQHVPLVSRIIEEIKSNALPEQAFPFLEGAPRPRTQQIMIFIVGGVSYEEACCVASMNHQANNVNILLGGTHMLNATTYV
jgi:vacuolar protein sorting-associated protein 45